MASARIWAHPHPSESADFIWNQHFLLANFFLSGGEPTKIHISTKPPSWACVFLEHCLLKILCLCEIHPPASEISSENSVPAVPICMAARHKALVWSDFKSIFQTTLAITRNHQKEKEKEKTGRRRLNRPTLKYAQYCHGANHFSRFWGKKSFSDVFLHWSLDL